MRANAKSAIRDRTRKVSVVLAVVLFYATCVFFVIALNLFQLGVNIVTYQLFMLTTITGTVTASGCAICVYLAIGLRKTKILKETYFYLVFVPIFSIVSYIVINCLLKIGLSAAWILLISTSLGTIFSNAFAGRPRRKIWKRLKKLVLTKGINIFTLILLGVIPIIEFLPRISPMYAIIPTSGTIAYGCPQSVVFESGNGTMMVQGQVTDLIFTAEVPIPANTTFSAKQVVNIRNHSPTNLDLEMHLDGLSGNLSRVERFRILLTFGNGSEICPLSINNGNVEYTAVCLNMKGYATTAIGVISLAQNKIHKGTCFLSLLMRLDNHKLRMNMYIHGVEQP